MRGSASIALWATSGVDTSGPVRRATAMRSIRLGAVIVGKGQGGEPIASRARGGAGTGLNGIADTR